APIITSGSHLAVAAYLAIVPMFLGYILFGHGLATVAASTATTVSLLEPAVAALLAVIVLREHLPPMGWLGLGLLFTSLVITATSTRPTTASHLGSRPAEGPDRAVTVTANADAEPACGTRTTETGTTIEPNPPGAGACSQNASNPPPERPQ